MLRLFNWLKKHIIHMLPTIIFFLIAFFLLDITDHVVNKTDLSYYSFVFCIMASLLMGKVVFIADNLSITGRYSEKPLIYSTLWKTLVYILCSIIIRIAEHLLPAVFEGDSFILLFQKAVEKVESPIFWVVQGWLTYLLIIFVGYKELISSIGEDKAKKLFLGNLWKK